MRSVTLRVVALAVLLLLVLAAVLTLQTMRRLPDTIVYLVSTGEATFELEQVGRQSRAGTPEERARAAVAHLAAGPTAQESARGLSTAVPAGTTVYEVSRDDGILHVDLSAEFERGGGSSQMQARLYQLFYTLTQPREIEGVVLSIEGDEVGAFSGEGILVESPWLRSRHPQLPIW